MAIVILYKVSAFQLHVTQKPLAEAVSSPEIPIPLRPYLKDKTQGLFVELAQKDHSGVKFM